MQHGGGIGYDFSTLRPRGARARATGNVATGPVSFMQVWDAACATITGSGPRGGAMMGTLRCDHPDVLQFIEAKRGSASLSRFNLSVQITDELMQAVASDAPWPLVFPSSALRPTAQSLPMVLTQFVSNPFSGTAAVEVAALTDQTRIAVRFLDNVLDVSRYPLRQQREQALRTRRIGLGVTGLADALIMLGLRYDGAAAREQAAAVVECMRDAAYDASIELAKDRGSFPAFDAEPFLAGSFIGRLPAKIRDGIARHGIRNSQLLALAPAGSISLLAGNVSSGIEPVFAFEGMRRVRTGDGWECHTTTDYVLRCWHERYGSAPLPDAFIAARDLDPEAHLAMQAALQPFVDGAISKTINLPQDYPFERHRRLFDDAHRLGLKGCTVFRPSPSAEGVLSAASEQGGAVGAKECCIAK